MLEYLFGNKNIEKILFFLLKQEKCYAGQLTKKFGTALYGLQTTLQKLEKAGVLASKMEGHTRFYQFNPRYPFLKELKEFLLKAYQFLPKGIVASLYEENLRTRPRRQGKPLQLK